MPPRLDGIDVSHHQKLIDWAAVATALPDLRFVMCRMSHGGRHNGNLRVDERGERNQREMRKHYPNTPRGYYHFLGNSDPEVQARHFRERVGEMQAGEFLMLDVEVDEPADVGHHEPAFIAAVLEAIEAAFTLTPWLYIPQPGNYPKSNDAGLHHFPLMLPVYDSESRFQVHAAKMGRPVMVWQWGGDDNGATVSGITTGRIDSNIVLDEARFVSTLTPGLSGTGTPTRGFVGAVTSTDPSKPLGFVRILEHGDEGNAVVLLQTLLIEHGIFQDADRNRDGEFGDGTRAGVQRFQLGHGLPATGGVDGTTWSALTTL
jgi:GH25 family lysozyme M1 (1,4-beta-N-acetylmuramidase)